MKKVIKHFDLGLTYLLLKIELYSNEMNFELDRSNLELTFNQHHVRPPKLNFEYYFQPAYPTHTYTKSPNQEYVQPETGST